MILNRVVYGFLYLKKACCIGGRGGEEAAAGRRGAWFSLGLRSVFVGEYFVWPRSLLSLRPHFVVWTDEGGLQTEVYFGRSLLVEAWRTGGIEGGGVEIRT